MKFSPYLAVFAFVLTVALPPTFASEKTEKEDTLFEFDGGIGSQPFRSSAGAPVANTVAGVNPGGAPWPIKSFQAWIKTDGTIRASARGILLGGGDNLGTRGGPRQMVISLFCRNTPVPPAVAGTLQTVPYNSPFVNLDENGNFQLEGRLVNASGQTPPANCGDKIDNRPVLLIRTVTPANPTTNTPATPGSWFAGGILKSESYKNKD